eukprot:153916-Prorocentrum_minimum.AAC.1
MSPGANSRASGARWAGLGWAGLVPCCQTRKLIMRGSGIPLGSMGYTGILTLFTWYILSRRLYWLLGLRSGEKY